MPPVGLSRASGGAALCAGWGAAAHRKQGAECCIGIANALIGTHHLLDKHVCDLSVEGEATSTNPSLSAPHHPACTKPSRGSFVAVHFCPSMGDSQVHI